MSNEIKELIHELIDTGLSSLFDPNPVYFKHEHEKGAAILRRLLSKPTFQIQILPKRLTRNAFLCGCLDFTENAPIEHLIIGYGTKRGIGTDVYKVQHLIGSESSISIPETVIANIDKHSYNVPSLKSSYFTIIPIIG